MGDFTSHFSPKEWDSLFRKFAGQDIAYRHVSQTQLSIARMFGGATVQGKHFTYMPATDELIRDDVLKLVAKRRREALKADAAERAARQVEIGGL